MDDFFAWDDDNLVLRCHVQANAKSTAIVGLYGNALKIRIAALPSEGKANLALTAFLAAQFGVRKKDVTLLSGHTHQSKRFKIDRPKAIPSSLSKLIACSQSTKKAHPSLPPGE